MISGRLPSKQNEQYQTAIEHERFEQIGNNVKHMLLMEDYLSTQRSVKISTRDILIFSALTKLETKQSEHPVQDAAWILGMTVNEEKCSLKSALLEQFVSVSSPQLIEETFELPLKELSSNKLQNIFDNKIRKFNAISIIKATGEFLSSCIIIVTPGKQQTFHTWLPTNLKNNVPIVIVQRTDSYFTTAIQEAGNMRRKRQLEELAKSEEQTPKQKRKTGSNHSNTTKCRSNSAWLNDNEIETNTYLWKNVDYYVMSQCKMFRINSYVKKHQVFQYLRESHPKFGLRPRTQDQIKRFSNKFENK